MATTKQFQFIRSLMIEKGYAHHQGYLRGISKSLPHGPTMRERSGNLDDWISRLTTKEASEVIESLLKN